MTVHTEAVPAKIDHECSNCRHKMTLPTWVSLRVNAETAQFQCPVCECEADIDIGDYPILSMRVVVNEWNDIVDAQECG